MAKTPTGKQISDGDESRHYVSPRQKRGKEKKAIQPPLTPMIDVTFQLLIFFLLTAQFMPPEGTLPGTVPGRSKAPQRDDLLKIQIDIQPKPSVTPDAEYVINQGEAVGSGEALYAWLENYKADYPNNWEQTRVVINPNFQARWQFTVEAYNQALRAGYKMVAFAPLN